MSQGLPVRSSRGRHFVCYECVSGNCVMMYVHKLRPISTHDQLPDDRPTARHLVRVVAELCTAYSSVKSQSPALTRELRETSYSEKRNEKSSKPTCQSKILIPSQTPPPISLQALTFRTYSPTSLNRSIATRTVTGRG